MVLAGLLASPALIPSTSVRPFSEIRRRWHPSDVRLLDRHGELLDEIRSDPNGRRLSWTPLPEVSQAMIAAVIKSEDRRFYQHKGIDYRAMAAAALARAIGHRRGGSTITMQLAALIQEGPRSHTLLYKFQQARMARALERKWTKDQILEAYLNLVTYRGEFQGIRSAATFLFGKEPHGITQPEAEIMAVLLRAPNASQRAVL